MAVWKFVDEEGNFVLDCAFAPTCYYHPKKILQVLKIDVLRFKNMMHGKPIMSNAIDVKMVCPECGSRELFGVALSEEEFDRIYKSQKSSLD